MKAVQEKGSELIAARHVEIDPLPPRCNASTIRPPSDTTSDSWPAATNALAISNVPCSTPPPSSAGNTCTTFIAHRQSLRRPCIVFAPMVFGNGCRERAETLLASPP